jgi:uncharacterized protein involved in type VI secretion and phage assembly
MIVLTGLVTKIDDDQNLGRVKVKFPQLSDDLETHWCRLVSTGGGKERGIQFIPEVGDEVLVLGPNMFDLFVLGGLWSSVDLPPYKSSDAASARDVKKRVIRSRTGHEILLDDGDQPGITIVDSSKNNKVHIDTSSNSLTAEVDGDITIKSKTGSITLDAKMGLTANAGTDLSMKGTASATIEGTGNATLKSTGSVRVEGGANASLSAATVSLG